MTKHPNSFKNQAIASLHRVWCGVTLQEPPSCFSCRHVSTWSYSGSWEEPPDSGWECQLSIDIEDLTDEQHQACSNAKDYDMAYAQAYAFDCPMYRFFNYQEEARREAQSELEMIEFEKALEQQMDEYYASLKVNQNADNNEI